MQPFTVLKGVAAPLMLANVDTDKVIRIERLVGTSRDELGPYLFEALRNRPDGKPDPDFVLNQAGYRDTRILLASDNFGCGSSREGAVWALQCCGIRCVIAPSFGEIFFNNCFQNGVLPIVLPRGTVEELADQAKGKAEFSVDLAAGNITTPNGEEIAFSTDPARREALLEGLDAISVTLKRRSEIDSFRTADRARRPWVYSV